ncbi:hypothetical protein GYRE_03950 [Yokenella regensburgei ATCC 49455]|nr:hypothetical protein GYRE_03950 [Yokenella regensburgei ATCC 49455]
MSSVFIFWSCSPNPPYNIVDTTTLYILQCGGKFGDQWVVVNMQIAD